MMQNNEPDAADRRAGQSLERRKPLRSDARKMVPSVTIALCVWAAGSSARALFGADLSSPLPADIVRVALSAAVFVYALGARFLPGRIHRRQEPRLSPKAVGILRTIAVELWTIALCWAELARGGTTDPALIGMAALALSSWEKPGRYLLRAAPLALAMAGLLALMGALDDASHLAIAVGGLLAGHVVARSIRDYMLPGTEKLRALESENKELWNLSYRDGLTGLYNRRYAQEGGARFFQKASKYREELHAIMLDIDHFKRVNDELSHAVGDVVLKEVAASIQITVRASDLCSRWGGEEFLVLLPGAEPELAQSIANRIRNTVETMRLAKVPWRVTVSIGITGLRQDDSLESLVDRADKFLYESKRNGRNRVTGY